MIIAGFGAAAFTRFASKGWRARQDSNLRPDRSAPETLSGQSCDPAEIEPLDDVVASQLVDRIRRNHDLAMDDDVTAAGDADRLIEVLLRHQHRQAETLIELADLGDSLRHQEWRQAHR